MYTYIHTFIHTFIRTLMEESRLFVRANGSQFARTYWPTDRKREGGGERKGQKKRQSVPEPKPYTLNPNP